jgi:hypothetical protein
MKQFSKSFTDWTITSDDRVQITYISSKGNTIDELFDNAEISFEDWHGNPIYFDYTAQDLSDSDANELVLILARFLDEQRVKNA